MNGHLFGVLSVETGNFLAWKETQAALQILAPLP